jgi:hypothetical protein
MATRQKHKCPPWCHYCPDMRGLVFPWCYGSLYRDDLESCNCVIAREVETVDEELAQLAEKIVKLKRIRRHLLERRSAKFATSVNAPSSVRLE